MHWGRNEFEISVHQLKNLDMNDRYELENHEKHHCLGSGAHNQEIYHTLSWLATGYKREKI